MSDDIEGVRMKERAPRRGVTASYVRELFEYSTSTGELTWLNRPRDHFASDRDCAAWNTRYAGKRAGAVSTGGYRIVGINRQLYCEHRIVWLYCTGEWPSQWIDHANLNPGDNRIENLREANISENATNRPHLRTNKLGVKGVRKCSKSRMFSSEITKDGTRHYLGTFETAAEAGREYARKAEELHREFARTK